MRVAGFMRSTPGRVTQVVAGGALLWYGAVQVTLFGLCLMMLGMLPLVAGISNEYPFDSHGTHAA
jgi:hypothetical protein